MNVHDITVHAAQRLTDRHRDADRERLLAHRPHPPTTRRRLARALHTLLLRLERTLDERPRPLEVRS